VIDSVSVKTTFRDELKKLGIIFCSFSEAVQEHLYNKMTKADIVAKIADKLGLEKGDVQATVESFMDEVKNSLETGDNVYLRGFGSFIVKTRAEKTGRNISKNTTIKIPAHNIPAFKPAKVFVEGVKTNNEAK
jgi:DNA-binding protein HU-beta